MVLCPNPESKYNIDCSEFEILIELKWAICTIDNELQFVLKILIKITTGSLSIKVAKMVVSTEWRLEVVRYINNKTTHCLQCLRWLLDKIKRTWKCYRITWSSLGGWPDFSWFRERRNEFGRNKYNITARIRNIDIIAKLLLSSACWALGPAKGTANQRKRISNWNSCF